MTVVQVTDVIHAGGAETFVLRLGQALKLKGHSVVFYILYRNKIDQKVARAMAPDVAIHVPKMPFFIVWQKIDGLLLRLGISFSFLTYFFAQNLRKYVKIHGTEIVHSHLFTADEVAVKAVEGLNIPVVTTMHGDYTLYIRKLKEGIRIRIVSFEKKMHRVLTKLNEIACISDEQLHFFRHRINKPCLPLHKIYNGYVVSKEYQKRSRKELEIGESDFIYGMVARGIPEKGWIEVIESFLLLNLPGTRLLLVGESAYVQELRKKYRDAKNIIFAGYSPNPIEYIELFDAGLFASTFFAESLPTVVIEYLNCSKPVVCVDIAECRLMLQAGNGSAGIMVPLEDGKVDKIAFANAMRKMAVNQDFFKQLRNNTVVAQAKFDMQLCVSQYETLYNKHARK